MTGRLFVLARSWGCKTQDGRYRTQALDGNFINHLGRNFRSVSLGMVVVDPAAFEFVDGYRGELLGNVDVVELRQTLRGSRRTRVGAQLRNLLVIGRQLAGAGHVVVFMSSLSAVWAAFGARLLNRRLLVYSGNDWAADVSLKFTRTPALGRRFLVRLTDILETVVLRLAHVRLVNSPKLWDKCGRIKGKSERVRPISDFCAGDALIREDTCQRDSVRIVYTAAIIPRKNHSRLLRAVSLLSDQGIEWELLLAGAFESNEIRNELLELAEELRIASRVHFLGYLADKGEMLKLLRGADIFVMPSLNEGFPRVVWEAMLQSLPCAVSRIPNIVADIGERNVAVMFDQTDPRDIADALRRIIQDGELRRDLVRRGNGYAREIFAEGLSTQLSRLLNDWA